MPIARYQMPDGRVARFEVPDGTTPEAAQTMMENIDFSQASAPTPPVREAKDQGIGRTAFDQAGQGLTIGLIDEGQDAFGAIGAKASDLFRKDKLFADKSARDLYKEARTNSQQRLADEMETRPVLSVASNLAGGLLTGGAGAATKAGTAVTNSLRSGNLAARVGKGALAGAASGGAYGFGTGSGETRLDSAGEGALYGAIGGGVIPGAASAASGIKNVGQRVGAMVGHEGAQQSIADKILAQRLTGEGFTPQQVTDLIAKAKGSGMSPTLGEATRSSGVLQAEKSIVRGTGKGANLMRDALFTRNRDAVPSTLKGFADDLEAQAGDVSGLYQAAAREASEQQGLAQRAVNDPALRETLTLDAAKGAQKAPGVVEGIKGAISARLESLGDVTNVETKALKQAQAILDNAERRGNTFEALHDAQKQLDNIFIEGGDSTVQKQAGRHVAQFRKQISETLGELAPENFKAANLAAKTRIAAGDIREAIDSTQEGSLAVLYNKVWAKPELRQEFLRKLPDDAARERATELFTQLENIKRGFGGSDTAFNLPANNQLANEAGIGFDPGVLDPVRTPASIAGRLGKFAQPGVYEQIAKQSINPDTARITKAMQKAQGGKRISGTAPALLEGNIAQFGVDKAPAAVATQVTPMNYSADVPTESFSPENHSPLFQRVIHQESRGNQSAVSPKGAIGVAQIMPGTAKEAAKLAGLPYDPFRLKSDANYNAALGEAYLNAQLKKYGGNEALALVAYNWGPGNADMWVKSGANPARLPKETRDYLTKILG